MSYKLFCVIVLLGCILYVRGQQYRLTTSGRYALVGSLFTFTCRRDFSSPVITWFVNNTEYRIHVIGSHGQCDFFDEYPKEYSFHCSGDRNLLIIKSVKLSQHGTVWRCGDFKSQSNEIKLEVKDGPETSLKLNTSSVVTAVEGSDVTVACSATCFITCNYQWKVADDVISNTSILSLADINRSQSGRYVCTAENPDTNQSAHKTLDLIVYYHPPELRGSAPYAISGLSFTFTCEILENSHRITWLVNDVTYGVLNSGPGHCDVMSRFSENYTYKCLRNKFLVTITSVDRNQQGNVWRCEDTDHRYSSNAVVLKVRDGPGSSLRINSSSDITVEEGSDVTISCKAECFIKCLYRWELTNQIVSNNGLLSLRNITRFQDGVYTCTAVNPDTSQTARTKIIIYVKCAVEDSSQFVKGFASCFGMFFILSAIIVVVLYVRYKIRKKRPNSNQQRISTNQQVSYSVAPVSDDETETAAEHEDTENTYSRLEERRNNVSYQVIMFDNDQTETAAVHQNTQNSSQIETTV